LFEIAWGPSSRPFPEVRLRFIFLFAMRGSLNLQRQETKQINMNSNTKPNFYANKKEPDLSWMETSDEAKGFRQWTPFPSIYYAVSKENPRASEYTKDWSRMKFDVPLGFHWCSTSEFLEIVGNSRGTELPYYNQEGWSGSTWNGKERHQFLFSDSETTDKYNLRGVLHPTIYLRLLNFLTVPWLVLFVLKTPPRKV